VYCAILVRPLREASCSMKLHQKSVPSRKADNPPAKTPAGKSKRKPQFVVLGTTRHGQWLTRSEKPNKATLGAPGFADSTKVPPSALRPAGGQPPACTEGTNAASQRDTGISRLSGQAQSAAKLMPTVGSAAIPGSPQTVVALTPAVTAGCPPEESLTDLLVAVRRAVHLLERIAEAAEAAQSKPKRPRPLVKPVEPKLLQHFAGKQMLNLSAVEALVSAKRSTIYGWIKDGKFVPPVHLSPKSSRWVASEVEAWLEERKRARDGEGLVAAADAQLALGGA
jgi:prophage regulatory protein